MTVKSARQAGPGSMVGRHFHPLPPPLAYVGNKAALRDWIIDHLPRAQVSRYVETCVGAGAVLCGLTQPYPQEVINDLDGGVTAFWRALRDQPEALRRACRATPYSRPEWLAARQQVRERGYPSEVIEAARLFVVLTQQNFGRVTRLNSGWRLHQSGRHNGWEGEEWGRLPERWPAVAARLHGVVIEQLDILQLLPRHDSPTTLFYIDPPYHPVTAPIAQCYHHWMTADQHQEMAEALASVAGMVVLSGYRCDDYDRWFAGWQRLERPHFSRLGIMRNQTAATARTECLWLNPAASAALQPAQATLPGVDP